jgi:molybdopterin-dependent oxidoreductase alpha subunit
MSDERVRHAGDPAPAAGPMAVWSSLRYAMKTSGPVRGLHVLRHVNQREGFDCPGCAWPEPAHRALAEFCENGARAVAHEADRRVVDAVFMAKHTIDDLRRESDHSLEHHGRLVEPMVRRAGATHYTPISWDDAFTLIASELRAAGPQRSVFYTSGRTSNEAAFLYQLMARSFGTNNLPDCSNMCHESSGKGLGTTIGVGKGTVQLADFDVADCILVIGQNPGTNHPRMMSMLQQAARRGCAIIVINPLREAALLAFAHPQEASGMLGVGTPIATQYLQVNLGGDIALLKGMMKTVLALHRQEGGVVDEAFLGTHVEGLPALIEDLDATSWTDIERDTALSQEVIMRAGTTYARAQRSIACWAMGITQHEHGVDNVRAIVNLMLLRGNVGKPGAGLCPVRGHSNVQGDRTMGIYEAPTEAWLAKHDAGMNMRSPRAHGLDVVHSIEAMERGEVDVFIGMGGNFVRATPDTPRVVDAMKRCKLTVHVSTKLNGSHVAPGTTALILPCLGRTEEDMQSSGAQFVSVENSMSVVTRSRGQLKPAGKNLRSEVAIVVGVAKALLGPHQPVDWQACADNYDVIRNHIERSIDGFSDYNKRVRDNDGFVLRNAAAHREFHTRDGKAALSVIPLPNLRLAEDELALMTLRSHDQFNTTVYELNDRYRGIHGRRDVLFMSQRDVIARGFSAGTKVRITNHDGGRERVLDGWSVVPTDMPAGCCAAYFPEANVLVPLERRARESHTPASKRVIVKVTAM